jgi:hypothetical protein
MRHVFGNQELRALALTAALSNLGSQIVNTMLPVVVIRELELPAGTLGLFWAKNPLPNSSGEDLGIDPLSACRQSRPVRRVRAFR